MGALADLKAVADHLGYALTSPVTIRPSGWGRPVEWSLFDLLRHTKPLHLAGSLLKRPREAEEFLLAGLEFGGDGVLPPVYFDPADYQAILALQDYRPDKLQDFVSARHDVPSVHGADHATAAKAGKPESASGDCDRTPKFNARRASILGDYQ